MILVANQQGVKIMIGAILDLIFAVIKLVIVIVCSYKFITGDMNENKTLYYGIWVLICL